MGCCLSIILLIGALIMAAIYFAAGLIALDIIFLLLFIASLGHLSSANAMVPSKMVCHNCGSRNIRLADRNSGRSTNATYGRWSAQMNTTVHYKRIAECKDCGFTWDYLMKEDIEQEKSKAKGETIIYGIVLMVLVIISVFVFF